MKSKMNFFLSVLLVLLFGMGLSTCSYASISKGYIDYALDLYKNGEIIDYNDVSNLDSQKIVDALNTILEADGLDINDYNLTILAPYTVNNSGSYFAFIINNNGASNNLDFLKMGINASYPNYLTISPENIVYMMWHNTKYNIVKKSDGINPLKINVTNTNNDSSIFNFNEALSVCTSQYFINKSPIGSVYIDYPNYDSENSYPMNLVNNATTFNEWAGITVPDEPDEPSGDESGGNTGGNTGNITNPSGDTTGKVDLSGIEQGIGAVKDAVNNVTNTIKDAFTFDSGDAKEVMQEFENTDLGLSQDLYDLNDQFFELFETEEMDDFKISWNGVNYQEAQLIPSGEVNFSAICRENEEIGKVKDYITLFAIVGASLTLLKVIWNMIAEMLGLNQTLMETDFGDAVMYTYEDNSYDIDTRAYLDSKRYNKRR